MCSETDFTQEKVNFQLLESPIPPLTAAALRMIICKRPAPHFDNHEKGIKMHFWDPSQWAKMFWVSKIQIEKWVKISYFLMIRAEEADPLPLTVSLTVKYPFFTTSLKQDHNTNQTKLPHCPTKGQSQSHTTTTPTQLYYNRTTRPHNHVAKQIHNANWKYLQ